MRLALACCLILAAAGARAAPAAPADALRAEILAADAELFAALNGRDLAGLQRRFSPTLEFYHDRGGISDYAANLRAFAHNFSQPQIVRREALPDTVRVYPAGPDAAMQIGEHRFCSAAAAGAREDCSIYGFAMVWRKEDGLWKLTRVLSYGH
ncbi:nuclear transport factor 2 family protein [Massilia sp. TS11]|uniref:nuclear transport factor 2 family protein n=1 Tax=Massilia sp. TS11 TaxID=2908003 RepID=UPI001EDAC610|nr:nuclear transport factor 2 family protein [Massilia sp. TS11]MCG2585066.1 nuclear transport factor 2 family protein [Massilia sp. TS11]